jgi:hypothetical protein
MRYAALENGQPAQSVEQKKETAVVALRNFDATGE